VGQLDGAGEVAEAHEVEDEKLNDDGTEDSGPGACVTDSVFGPAEIVGMLADDAAPVDTGELSGAVVSVMAVGLTSF
jgi:hypothetical protein